MLDLLLTLSLLASSPQAPAPDPAEPQWMRVDVSELVLDREFEPVVGPSRTVDTDLHGPRVWLDGDGEARLVMRLFGNVAVTRERLWNWLQDAVLLAEVQPGVPLTGQLAIPDQVRGSASLRFAFEAPADALRPASRADLAAAELGRARRLLDDDLPGAPWFRHLHDRCATASRGSDLVALLGLESDQEAWQRWSDRRSESDTFESIGFFSGGRALSENLQLDRLPPDAADASGATVALDELEGIAVRPFDWEPHVRDLAPELDPLAHAVPDDQYVLFAASPASLDAALDALQSLGDPIVRAFEQRSRHEGVRARYEQQLCLPLDGLATSLGGLVVRSVALTGSDPYFRMGTDLAAVLETSAPEAVAAYLGTRHTDAAQRLGAQLREVPPDASTGRPAIRVATSADRSVRSLVAALPDRVIVSNSMPLLERLLDLPADGSGTMSGSDEYRFFRARYERGADGERAFVVVPDEAIRLWGSPRWRIASARRTHAQALLADLQVEADLGERASRFGPSPLRQKGRLGTVGRESGADGRAVVLSSVYGAQHAMTPVSELSIQRVTEQEAELYRRWRQGYERNWSNYFDPIAVRLSESQGRTGLDLTVVPLIAGSDYRELIESVGSERLEGRDGDPTARSLVHFAAALDPEGEELRDAGAELAGMFEDFGANALAWLGDWWSVHAEEGELLDMLLEAEDLDDAWDTIEADLEILPIVFQVGVRSPLRLAAFMTALRGLAEGSAPGLVDWRTERTADGRPYVQISSAALSGDDLSIFYATTPKALIVSFSRDALVSALDRWNPPRPTEGAELSPEPLADDAPTPWLGESAAFELDPRALLYLGLLGRDGDPRDLARAASWSNLPALDEWHRLFPDQDPIEVHARLFGERLVCPGGGEYVWDPEWQRMRSTLFGHPDAPLSADPLPPFLQEVERLRFGLTFETELDGLRARAEVLSR